MSNMRWMMAVVLLCGLLSGASAQTSEQKLKEGEEAFKAEQFEKAYDIFSALFREHPDDIRINFALGEAAFAVDKLSHAALAYERILMKDPKNDRARLELGRVYFAMKQYEFAQEQFRNVLEHNPPPIVRQNIEKFMARIKAERRTGDWWGRLEIAGFYDDNVNVGPDSELINTTLGDLSLNPETQAQDVLGISVSASVDGYYDVGEKDGWSAFGDGSVYVTRLNDATEQELELYKLGGGLQRPSAKGLLQLPLSVQHLVRGHDRYMDIYSLRPTYLHALSTTWHWISTVAGERRDYVDLDTRDGYYTALEQTLRWFLGEKKHALSLGAIAFRENTRDDAFTNNGWEGSLLGELRLPWKMTSYMRLRFRDSYYEDREPLATEDRHDRQWQGIAGLSKALTRQWGVNASYSYTDNASTFDLYEYTRNIITVSTYWSF
ncbi:MAG: DUF560 domain-containing protein [Lentisphaerae bacterium]|nr:DUF560 domain-containing protein [Lentisphaerota bacterium]